MPYKRESLLKDIIANLKFLPLVTSGENSIGLFDKNRVAQEFFRGLFGYVFVECKDISDLDKLNEITNFPSIDLGDEAARVAFQITTDDTSEKIKDTLSKFIKYELFTKYDRLIHFIIGSKKNYTTVFDVEGKFTFTPETDIIDIEDLIKLINNIGDISVLNAIKCFLEEQLFAFKQPDGLSDTDIKNCIHLLERDLSSMLTTAIIDPNYCFKTLSKHRTDDYINATKNPLNNISVSFYKENISGHWKYNKLIIDFLSSPINGEYETKYWSVVQLIKNYYETGVYDTFEEIFERIFNLINIKYSDNLQDKGKIAILLHNMYLNCDIGKNSI